MKVCLIDCLPSKTDDLKEIYRKYTSLPTGMLFRILSEHGHEVHVCPSLIKSFVDADVFHAHNLGYASLYLALIKKRPLVFTSHNGLITCRYKSLKTTLARLLIGKVLKNADMVIALCERESRMFQEEYHISPEKIRIIHNGIDIDYYLKSDDAIISDNENIKLLCVAHLEAYKGIEYLIRALKIAKEEHGSIELVIVSIGQSRLKQHQELVRSLSLVNNVHFLKSLSSDGLKKLYYLCDIYIQPSLAEDLPTVITEAMACGKPVIATDVGGIPEQVTKETGILVAPKDIAGLADAIKLLSGNPRLREKMGKQGKDRAVSYFNKDVMYEKHIEVYKELLTHYAGANDDSFSRYFKEISMEILYSLLRIKELISGK